MQVSQSYRHSFTSNEGKLVFTIRKCKQNNYQLFNTLKHSSTKDLVRLIFKHFHQRPATKTEQDKLSLPCSKIFIQLLFIAISLLL